MSENKAFTERCINELQRISINSHKAQAMTDYLKRHGRLSFDETRGLFWVRPVSGPLQVAAWMMDVCPPAASKAA